MTHIRKYPWYKIKSEPLYFLKTKRKGRKSRWELLFQIKRNDWEELRLFMDSITFLLYILLYVMTKKLNFKYFVKKKKIKEIHVIKPRHTHYSAIHQHQFTEMIFIIYTLWNPRALNVCVNHSPSRIWTRRRIRAVWFTRWWSRLRQGINFVKTAICSKFLIYVLDLTMWSGEAQILFPFDTCNNGGCFGKSEIDVVLGLLPKCPQKWTANICRLSITQYRNGWPATLWPCLSC